MAARPGTGLQADQAVRGAFDDDQYAHRVLVLGSLIPEEYDEVDLSYTVDDLTTVVYKLNSVTVGTLTLTYTLGKLTNIVRS